MIPIILLQEQWTGNRSNSSQKSTKGNWPIDYIHTYIATLWHPANADYLSPGFVSSLVGLSWSQNSASFPSGTQQPTRAHAAGRHTVIDTSSGLAHYPLPLQHTPHSDPLFPSYTDTGCTWHSYLEPEEKKNILGTNPDMRNFSQTYKARRTALRTLSYHPSSFKNTLTGVSIPLLSLTSF